MKVWFDDFSLAIGDSLRESIDRGLAHSRFGIVILSHRFFAKDWPKKELNGLATLEVAGRKMILPIWHGIGAREVRFHSPMLADRVAVTSDKGLHHVVEKLLSAAGLPAKATSKFRARRGNTTARKSAHKTQKTSIPLDWQSLAIPMVARSTTQGEKPTRGRPTIPDNFLLGARDQWAAFLEECWPEIGRQLLSIRNQKNGTLEYIRTIFQPLSEKQHNSGLAAPFYRESAITASPTLVRKNREQCGKWDAEILQIQTEHEKYQRLCGEAEMALRIADPVDKDAIRDVAAQREQHLRELSNHLRQLKDQRDSLDLAVRNQEAYVFRAELLQFLHSGWAEINPQIVANAVAGLPMMGWRQSLNRCSGMPLNPPRLEYSVFEVIAEIWSHRSKEFEVAPVEFFRTGLLKLSKKWSYPRQFLCDKWRDLRSAIDECWKSTKPPDFIPFELTSIFMRYAKQQKNAAEQILAERDKLQV